MPLNRMIDPGLARPRRRVPGRALSQPAALSLEDNKFPPSSLPPICEPSPAEDAEAFGSAHPTHALASKLPRSGGVGGHHHEHAPIVAELQPRNRNFKIFGGGGWQEW